MTICVPKTRKVGNIHFSATTAGEWLIHSDTLSTEDVKEGLALSRGAQTPEECLKGHLTHLHVGPSHFNLCWEPNSPGFSAHVERITTLAFMSTAERLHFEWEAHLTEEVVEELVTAIGRVREREGMGLKSVSHSVKWRPGGGTPDLKPLHEAGCELHPYGSVDELLSWLDSQELNEGHPGSCATVLLNQDKPEWGPLLSGLKSGGFERIRAIPQSWETLDFQEPPHSVSAYKELFKALLKEGGIREMGAGEFLCRLLHHKEPLSAPMRNPSSAGRGQLSMGTGGAIYTCRRGRLLHEEEGVEDFWLGHITSQGYHDFVTHPSTRALVLATTLSSQPGWNGSPYERFAGVDPVLSFVETGSIHGNMNLSQQARFLLEIFDGCIEGLASNKVSTRDRMEDWGNLSSFGGP